jgi:hypothetical protein
MPSCLAKRESVVEDRISGLDSSPPAEAMAFSNVSHHGFDAFVAVDTGRPATSVTGPFCTSCSNKGRISAGLGLFCSGDRNDSGNKKIHLVGQVFVRWCPFLFDPPLDLLDVFGWRKAEVKADLRF